MMTLASHAALAENQNHSFGEALYCFSLIVTKKITFRIKQALCQTTPTGKLTDPHDKNQFKKIRDLWTFKESTYSKST